ncbi:hypothetical protein ACGFZL_31010 [Streptomyces sp. NPDC048182]|uniref:hypothetical protein n=1 Tax=Streptomyces sp. NPDC048182 TaxID=3365507 RepID=UPI0037180BC7
MSDPNNDTKKAAGTRAAETKARETAAKATAPASKAGQAAADKAGDAASAAKSGVERSAQVATGAVQSAAQGVEAGRQAVITASGHVAATAKTAWTIIANRKLVAAGAAAGLAGLTAASYAVGRRSGRQAQGPLTRLTSGRI